MHSGREISADMPYLIMIEEHSGPVQSTEPHLAARLRPEHLLNAQLAF